MSIILFYFFIVGFLGIILLIHFTKKYVLSAILYPVFIIVILISFLEIKGTAKNISYEWRDITTNTVLGGYLDEPNAIYVWLLDSDGTPKSYVIPWNINIADEIQKMLSAAKSQSVRIELDVEKLKEMQKRGRNFEDNNQIYIEHTNQSLPSKVPR